MSRKFLISQLSTVAASISLFIFIALFFIPLLITLYQAHELMDASAAAEQKLFVTNNLYRGKNIVINIKTMPLVYLITLTLYSLNRSDLGIIIPYNCFEMSLLCYGKHFLIALYFPYNRPIIIALTPIIISYAAGCYSTQIWQIIRCGFVRFHPPWSSPVLESQTKSRHGGWHWYL